MEEQQIIENTEGNAEEKKGSQRDKEKSLR